jgi:TRAP-type C4-dicarboxylate transport system permease small subunit
MRDGCAPAATAVRMTAPRPRVSSSNGWKRPGGSIAKPTTWAASMIAVRDRSHFDVDLLPHPKTPRQKGLAGLVVHLTMLAMAVVFIRYGYAFAKFGAIQSSEMSGINMLSIYIAFPLAGVTWALFLAENIAADIRLLRQPATESSA